MPIASNEYGTPPPVISFTISTGSAFEALIVSVAPICLATSSFDATVSIAMMRDAPAIAAPFTADRPMPPQPITATVEPGSTFAAWNTAPTPVITPQPTSAQRSSGTSSRTFTTACSCTSIFSAKADRLQCLVQHLAFPGEPARRAGQQLHLGVLAEVGMAGHALRAFAAEHRQAGDDVIAGLDVGDVVADRLDHAGRLVAEHAGGGERIQAFHEMQVGVAEAGKGGAHQHLAPLRAARCSTSSMVSGWCGSWKTAAFMVPSIALWNGR